MKTFPILFALALFLSTAGPALADEAPPVPTFTFSLQERARLDWTPDFDWDASTAGSWSIGNRARVGVKAALGPVSAFVQIQDVRRWGSEFNPANQGEGTLFDWSADGLDVHQAYGALTSPFGLELRIGRQEINWQGQRLIGAVGWTHQGRSFDAVRLRWDGTPAGAEFFYALLLDRPVSAEDDGRPLEDTHLLAVRGGPRVAKALTLDGLAIVRIDTAASEVLGTFGAHAKGEVGPLRYEIEGYGQAGTRGASTVAAYLFGVRAGAAVPEAAHMYVGGGFDLVSGDPDPTDDAIHTFDTLYATNHKFYGHADRYLALPKHTAGQGLVDGLFSWRVKPVDGLAVKVDVHAFAAPAPADADRAFAGVETDVELKVTPIKNFSVSAGVWIYAPGPLHGADGEPEAGGFLMTDFRL